MKNGENCSREVREIFILADFLLHMYTCIEIWGDHILKKVGVCCLW